MLRRPAAPFPCTRARTALLAVAVPVALVAVGTATSSVSASPTAPHDRVVQLRTPAADNPLAGHKWGVYKGNAELAWQPYAESTGERRKLLAKIALEPKAKWFGNWIKNAGIADKVDDYIENSTKGDPDVLVQMTNFRMNPWEHDLCGTLPSQAQIDSYKQWNERMAKAIGNARVAMILQPDGPFALCAKNGSKLPSRLIRYAARLFDALPRTTVYIEAGAADWLRDNPKRAARILIPAGIEGVRGFALNGTHYDSTRREIEFGTSIVKLLEDRGIPGKHFVINTSSNGRPFAGYNYDGANFNNARTCKEPDDPRHCVTLGIPPTTDVADPRWKLSEANRDRAARYVDAYLWWGRPWLYNQASPFVMKRALAVARTTPF